MKKLTRQYRNGRISHDKVNAGIQSWIGHASQADTFQLRKRVLGSVAFKRGGAQNAPRRFVGQRF